VSSLDPAQLGWESFWDKGAAALRGRVGVLDDSREALGMALLRRGVTDINTEDAALLQRASEDLQALNDSVRVKVTITGYETLPAGRMWMNQVWSGDMLNAVISYLPEGTSADVLSYWYQQAGGPIFNDCICVAANAEKPVLAHRFLNYLLDPKVAMDNFIGYVGYQPPLTKIDAQSLFDQQLLPEGLRNCVVTREDYATGNGYLALTAGGRRQWDQSWSAFRNG
jgi:spermidine/putrescine-binding protein